MMANNKLTMVAAALLAVVAMAACTDHELTHSDNQGETRLLDIRIAQPTASLTRAAPDSYNDLKTYWDKGDKLHLIANFAQTSDTITGTATYSYANGGTWEHNLRVPVGSTISTVTATYIGYTEPSIPAALVGGNNNDIQILQDRVGNVSSSQPIVFNNFRNLCTRLVFRNGNDILWVDGSRGFLYNTTQGLMPEASASSFQIKPAERSTYYRYINKSDRGIYYRADGRRHNIDLGNTEDDPTFSNGRSYVIDLGIKTADQARLEFQDWAQDPNKGDFTLTCDIDLEEDWEPINYNGQAITLNGNGYTIRGLNIYKPSDASVGLFGTCSNITINNLHVQGTVTGDNHVGGIIGNADGCTLNNVSFTGQVTGNTDTGGLVGYAGDSYIFGSHFIQEGSNSRVNGGIAGILAGNAKVLACYSNNESDEWKPTGWPDVDVEVINQEISNWNATAGNTPCNFHWVPTGSTPPAAIVTGVPK